MCKIVLGPNRSTHEARIVSNLRARSAGMENATHPVSTRPCSIGLNRAISVSNESVVILSGFLLPILKTNTIAWQPDGGWNLSAFSRGACRILPSQK